MSDYNELLKTIDDALAQTDKAQEPKNPTQAILDEIDAALGEKPEAAPVPSVTPTPVESVTPAPVPSVTPQPVVAVTPAPVATPQPSPTPSPVSQPVAELPKPTPSRLPEPTPPKEPEVDYSLPSNQFLAMVKDIPDEKWGKDEVDFLNTLSGKDLSEIKKQRPDVIFDDIINQKIFDYQRETTPYKIPETKEDFYNLTKASVTFLGRDVPVMASELVGDVLVGGAKAVKQGVPELLGFNSTYSKALQGLELLSPEKKKEVLDWQTQAFFILNTPLKGGEKPNPNSYTDDLFLKKVQEGLSKEQTQALDQEYEKKRMEAKQVPFETLAPLADLPPSLAFLGTKLATGGFQTWDSISEQFGLLTKEQAYERWKTRELLDSVKAKMAYEEPRAWARAMDVYKPIYAPTFSYFASLSTPSVEEMMIMDPKLTKEEAESKRKATIEANVLDSIEETKKSIPETDPELQAFGDVAIPGGFGLDTFGYALNVVNASKMLTPIARLKLKKLRYTDDEINALESKAQRVLKEKQLKELESKKTAGLVERAAGATAKGIEATGEYLERSPKFQAIAKYTPYVTGIGLGYEIDPENPLRGMVAGGLTAAGVKAGFKTLKETPKVIKEISAARRISAGGEMRPLATLESIAKQQDEVKNLTAKLKTLSEGTEEYIDTKKLLDDAKDKAKGIKEGGGEVVDYEGIGKVSDTTKKILRFASDDLISNIGEYAKMGIEPTILGLSMGMIDSSDEEELKGMIGSGLVFSLGGRAMQQGFHKFLGEDPVIAARKSRQASMDALKAYRDSSPETQGEIDRLTDWTNVLQRQENKIGQAQSDLQSLQAEGASPDKIKKAEKVLSAEQKSLSLLKTANVQTRNEFGKNFLQQLARNNMLINGSLKAGQNNVGFHILSTQQIFDHFRKKPEYRDVSDEDLMMRATQQGFYSGTGGNEYRPGMEVSDAAKGLVFDTSKPSIVVNSDALQNRMMIFGETPTEALNHETGHHFARIPEIQNAMGDPRKVLFTNEIKDASGAVKEISNGLYSEKQLNEMFVKDYLKNRPKDQVAEIAKNLGVWDYNTNSLNAKDVGSYMQEEILAELFSNTLSRNLGKNLDSKQLHLLDVARLKMKNNLLKNAVTKVLGLGASSDVVSELTNAKLPPEAQSAARNAVRLIQSMNGDFSTMASMPQAAPISKAEIKKSKIAAERYGMDSGLFATKVVAQVFDADGNPVGAAVDVNDPSVYEGSWRISKDGEERLSGYGQIPVQLRQLQVPEGGTLSIAKQVATEVDGVTPKLLNPKDLKKLQQDRASLFKQAIDTPDYGTPGRFEAVSEGSQTYRGSFTPMQIKAIQDLPEGIVPLKIKKYLLDLNEAIVKKDGTRFYVDYAAVMDDKGNYKAFSPKIYDVVPIGLHLSKDGNFLVTTISAGRMIEKLNLWSDRMPNRLNPWGGSKEAFWADFSKKYLDNWTKGIEGSGYKNGVPVGNNQLDPDYQKAEEKKSILNDYLNLFTNETRPLNLERTQIPRKKGDPKNKSADRTIMSMRVDHFAELLSAEHLPKLPIDYGKAIINFMPAEIEAPSGERGFKSKLQTEIQRKFQGANATPQQLKAVVGNPQFVKPEEVKWSGVMDEIDRLAQENKGKVPVQELLNYLRDEGQVKFEEVTLGGVSKLRTQDEIDQLERQARRTGRWDEYEQAVLEFEDQQLGSDANQTGNQTKYAQYQLPGGTNYREVVLSMPDLKKELTELESEYQKIRSGSLGTITSEMSNRLTQINVRRNQLESEISNTYTSSHFPDVPNYIAHMRLNERTDAEGNDGLFVEEFQADRHQAGREKGYQEDKPTSYKVIIDGKEYGEHLTKEDADNQISEFKKLLPNSNFEIVPKTDKMYQSGIPDAPFRKDWGVQLFKRALRDAVESGKSWIGWTTGETQAERYDLRKQVDSVAVGKFGSGWQVIGRKDGEVLIDTTADSDFKLAETIGKDLAEKAIQQGGGTFQGEDLKVGGEGMKGFYDTILPKDIGKYVAKMGGKVEKSEISAGKKYNFELFNPQGEPKSVFVLRDQITGKFLADSEKETFSSRAEDGELMSQKAAESMVEAFAKDTDAPIWKVNITPEMENVVRAGQIQFMPEQPQGMEGVEAPQTYRRISDMIPPLQGVEPPVRGRVEEPQPALSGLAMPAQEPVNVPEVQKDKNIVRIGQMQFMPADEIPTAKKVLKKPLENLPLREASTWTEIQEAPIITLKDLIGKKVFPTFADITSAGRVFKGIDSSELLIPIETHGGPEWPLIQAEKVGEETNVWSNQGAGVTTTKAKRADEGAIMLVTLMDKNAHMSNTEVANAIIGTNVAYVRDKRIPEKNLKLLNKKIKSEDAFNDFVGIDAPDINDYVSKLPFQGDKSRARLATILSLKESEELGAANVQRILDEMRSPEFEGGRIGDSVIALQLSKGAPVVKLSDSGGMTHPSYQYAVRGKVIGKFARPINAEMIYDDFLAQRRAEGKPQKGDRRAIDLAKPVQVITEQIASRIPQTPYKYLKSAQHAKLLKYALENKWKDSGTAKNKGGISPAEFIDTLNSSEAKVALNDYTLDSVKKEIKDGKLNLYQLGDSKVFFGTKNTNPASDYGLDPKDYGFGENEKTLTLVLNAERGTAGMGDAIMMKALSEGVTALDCFAIKNSRYPDGMLPSLYKRFGFEVVGEIPFDPQYYTPQKLADIKLFWKNNGWDESTGLPSVVLMKWKGNENDRTGSLRDIAGKTPAGIRERNTSPIRDTEGYFGRTDIGQSGVPQGGLQQGESGRGRGSAGDALQGIQLGRGTINAIQELLGMNDAELKNLGIDPAQIKAIKKAVGMSQ